MGKNKGNSNTGKGKPPTGNPGTKGESGGTNKGSAKKGK